MPLDQGTRLASKSPSGCRPDNALNRLGSPPGVGGVVVDGVYTVLLNVYLPHFEHVLETKTITETVTIIQTYMTVE